MWWNLFMNVLCSAGSEKSKQGSLAKQSCKEGTDTVFFFFNWDHFKTKVMIIFHKHFSSSCHCPGIESNILVQKTFKRKNVKMYLQKLLQLIITDYLSDRFTWILFRVQHIKRGQHSQALLSSYPSTFSPEFNNPNKQNGCPNKQWRICWYINI